MKALIITVYLLVAPVSVLICGREKLELNTNARVITQTKITSKASTDFYLLNDIEFVLLLFERIQGWFVWWLSLLF